MTKKKKKWDTDHNCIVHKILDAGEFPYTNGWQISNLFVLWAQVDACQQNCSIKRTPKDQPHHNPRIMATKYQPLKDFGKLSQGSLNQ